MPSLLPRRARAAPHARARHCRDARCWTARRGARCCCQRPQRRCAAAAGRAAAGSDCTRARKAARRHGAQRRRSTTRGRRSACSATCRADASAFERLRARGPHAARKPAAAQPARVGAARASASAHRARLRWRRCSPPRSPHAFALPTFRSQARAERRASRRIVLLGGAALRCRARRAPRAAATTSRAGSPRCRRTCSMPRGYRAAARATLARRARPAAALAGRARAAHARRRCLPRGGARQCASATRASRTCSYRPRSARPQRARRTSRWSARASCSTPAASISSRTAPCSTCTPTWRAAPSRWPRCWRSRELRRAARRRCLARHHREPHRPDGLQAAGSRARRERHHHPGDPHAMPKAAWRWPTRWRSPARTQAAADARLRHAHRRLRLCAHRAHERRVHQPPGAGATARSPPGAPAASACGISRSTRTTTRDLESKVADIAQCARRGQGRSHPRHALPEPLRAGGHRLGARGSVLGHAQRRTWRT